MLNNHCIGLAVKANGLCAIKAIRQDRRLTIVSAKSVAFASPSGPPEVGILRAGFGSLALSSRPGLQFQVALPDPSTVVGIFKFKRLPRTSRDRSQLLRMRFEEEYGVPASDLKVAYQPLKDGSEGVTLFAVAAFFSWLEPFEQACAQEGLLAHVVDAASCFKFNLLRSYMDPTQSGALLSVEADSWSLMLWSAGPVLCRVHSRWRENPGTDLEAIVLEALRRLRSFLAEYQHQVFGCLYVCANEGEVAALQTAADARLNLPSRPFPLVWSSSGIELGTHSCDALAAALAR